MIETLKASTYYRRPTPGTVVLVNGAPTHFVGRTARADAKYFAEKMRASV